MAITLLPFIALISAAAHVDLEGGGSWLRGKGWVKLGEWSFALYLIHDLFIKLLGSQVGYMSAPQAIATRLILSLIVVPTSGVIHMYLEKPALRWLMERKLLGSRDGPTPKARRTLS